ncbi:hypothetical protein B0H16DRAFT_1551360 [Mycena metata]|uniref:Secreted protein n=1 Tax=Mycena metata TaxID=1033252 RepID=A0AAD7IUG7_9AGAR|nr:hypothetical protein B0H16DRAFT_1551360 [Mycena metata]
MCTFIILVILSPLLLTSSSFRRLRLLITLHFFFSHYGHSIGRTSTRRRGRRKGTSPSRPSLLHDANIIHKIQALRSNCGARRIQTIPDSLLSHPIPPFIHPCLIPASLACLFARIRY